MSLTLVEEAEKVARDNETKRCHAEWQALDELTREELISVGGVLDLRPRLAELSKQRELAKAYRHGSLIDPVVT